MIKKQSIYRQALYVGPYLIILWISYSWKGANGNRIKLTKNVTNISSYVESVFVIALCQPSTGHTEEPWSKSLLSQEAYHFCIQYYDV